MKRIGIILIAGICCGSPLFSQYVTIPDTSFLYALIENGADVNGDSLISYEEAENQTFLNIWGGDIWGWDINDMTGIEAFINLEVLYVCCIPISELDLSSNTALRFLYCSNIELVALDLSKNINLEELDFFEMPRLQAVCVCWDALNVPGKPFSVFIEQSPYVYFTNDCLLQYLNITDTAFLYALIEEGLDTNGDSLINMDEAKSTRVLNIADKGISNLRGIEGFVNLDTLYCSNNSISKIDLYNNIHLKYLDCSGSGLQHLGLYKNFELSVLFCPDNQFEVLDISRNTSLERIDIGGMNTLSEVCVWSLPFPPGGVEVDTSGSPNLYYSTYCANQIIDIPDAAFLSALIHQGVDTSGDSLISYPEAEAVHALDISGEVIWDDWEMPWTTQGEIYSLQGLEVFRNLDTLNCSDNRLTTLDISMNKALRVLNCSNNQITELDVSRNTALVELHCGDNYLAQLDVSNNTSLESLHCEGNALTVLDLSNNFSIISLNLENSPSLESVCVWITPFPPDGVEVYTGWGPEIMYTRECGENIDLFEDNDSQSDAVPLLENLDYNDLIVSENDDDWYELSTSDGTLITAIFLDFSFDPSEGSIGIDVVDSDGKVLRSPDFETDSVCLFPDFNGQDSYFIRVYRTSGDFIGYSLRWTHITYLPRSELVICTTDTDCDPYTMDPFRTDTTYTLDTLKRVLLAGDLSNEVLTFRNRGPDPYYFYAALDCPSMVDSLNHAVQFDGVDDYIRVNRSPSLENLEQLTLESWIRIDPENRGETPVISKGLNGFGFELFVESGEAGSRLGFRADPGEVRSSQVLEYNQWVHVAATCDTRAIRLYVNGNLDTLMPVNKSISTVNQDLFFGTSDPRAMNRSYFRGAIDEVRVWNVARRSWMIHAFMRQALTGNEEGLMGYWPLDGNRERMVSDLTSNSIGIMIGGAMRMISSTPICKMFGLSPEIQELPADSILQFPLEMNASNLVSGYYSGNLNIISTGSAKPDLAVPLCLRIMDAPSFTIFPDTVSIGKSNIYETHTAELEVFNHGTQPLEIDSIQTDLLGSMINPSRATILPGERKTFVVTIFQRKTGMFSGNLTFYTNDPSDPEVVVPITGEATPLIRFAFLTSIDTIIEVGQYVIETLKFPNSSAANNLTLYTSKCYYSLSNEISDMMLLPDQGTWLSVSLPYIIGIPPGGTLIFQVMLDAGGLTAGDYFAELVFEWYNPSITKGYFPITLHVIDPTGISVSDHESNNILIYPNPTHGPVTIQARENGPTNILITSMNGQLVYSAKMEGTTQRVDLSSLPEGLYLITLRSNNQVVTRKIMKL